MASLKDARAVIEEGGCKIGDNSLILLTKLIRLVWALLQELKRLLIVLAPEDLP